MIRAGDVSVAVQLLSHLGRYEEAEAWIHGPGPGVTRAESTAGPVHVKMICQSYPQGRIEREVREACA